jgi:penicillin-binding protein 1C
LKSPNKKNLFTAVALAIILLVLSLFTPLPKPLVSLPYATTMIDKNGNLLGAQISSQEQWHFKSTDKLNPKYVTALVQFEDKRFFQHFGIDFIALARAIYTDIKAKKIVSGGSTISMQLARISQNNQDRTIVQKLLEMWIALRIEIYYSKNEILKMYADSAPFGGNTIGISAASWRYFGRSTEQLTWAEASLLAVLPNSPSLIHLSRAREQLKAKRDKLLKKLYENQYISKLDYELSILEPLPNKPKKVPREASHLMSSLQKEYPQEKILHTTIDKDLQQKINNIAQNNSVELATAGVNNLAIVVVDNKTMELKAYVGNKAFMNKSEFANLLDVAKRPRSTGSTLKPLLFASVIDDGYLTPSTLVTDTPSYYAGYMPTNYDERYRGVVTAQEALIQSLNVPTVKILHGYGYKKFYDQLKQYGMTTLFRSAEDYGLALILGGAETTLYDLVNIYANISNTAQGIHFGKFLKIKALEDMDLEYIGSAPLSEGAAYLTLEAIKQLKRPGIDEKIKNLFSRNNIAWKTGTSYGLRDAWSIGTTPEYTVGVWCGNATGEGVSGLSGTQTAAPIMFEIFGVLDIVKWFDKPFISLKQIDVCVEDGYLATDICESKKIDMPIKSNFRQTSPYRVSLHIDPITKKRVDSNCEKAWNMQEKHFFVLPANEAYFYKQINSIYKGLPEYRSDCKLNSSNETKVIEINYPAKGHSIYLPQELDGTFGMVTLKARHQTINSRLYWHIDDKFIGITENMHDMSLYIKPGKHLLLIMDSNGNRTQRYFNVLAKDGTF